MRPAQASAVLLLAALACGMPAAAQTTGEAGARLEQPERNAARGRIRTPRMRAAVYEQLAEAERAAEANDFSTALRLLEELQRNFSGGSGLNSYERANLHYFYAFIHQSQGKLAEATRSYEKVLEQRHLPQAMELGTRYSLAELYIAGAAWEKAAAMLKAWFRIAPAATPTADARALLAQACYEQKQFAPALRELETALAETRRRGLPAREPWYVLKRVLHYAQGDLPATVATLRTLVQLWPRKEYLIQLSGLYGEMHNEPARLAAMEAALLGGWLREEQELVSMAYLYLDAGVPWKAARVLETALEASLLEANAKNLELLGIAWRQAREDARAIPFLERAAALEGDGEKWARLASIQLDQDNFAKAADAAREALQRGGGRRPDNTRVVLGMALFNLHRYDEARTVFTEARAEGPSAKIATQWLEYLDSQVERERLLAKEA